MYCSLRVSTCSLLAQASRKGLEISRHVLRYIVVLCDVTIGKCYMYVQCSGVCVLSNLDRVN